MKYDSSGNVLSSKNKNCCHQATLNKDNLNWKNMKLKKIKPANYALTMINTPARGYEYLVMCLFFFNKHEHCLETTGSFMALISPHAKNIYTLITAGRYGGRECYD